MQSCSLSTPVSLSLFLLCSRGSRQGTAILVERKVKSFALCGDSSTACCEFEIYLRMLWRQESSHMAFTTNKKMPLRKILLKFIEETRVDAFLGLCVVLSEVWEQHRFRDQSLLCMVRLGIYSSKGRAAQCCDHSGKKTQTKPFLCVYTGTLTIQCWDLFFWSSKVLCHHLSQWCPLPEAIHCLHPQVN